MNSSEKKKDKKVIRFPKGTRKKPEGEIKLIDVAEIMDQVFFGDRKKMTI